MTLLNRAYQAVFRRSSTFFLTIMVGAFFFERAFDQTADFIWERQNQGKLWSHVHAKIKAEKDE